MLNLRIPITFGHPMTLNLYSTRHGCLEDQHENGRVPEGSRHNRNCQRHHHRDRELWAARGQTVQGGQQACKGPWHPQVIILQDMGFFPGSPCCFFLIID